MKQKKTTISYYKKPPHLSIAEWQKELRKQFIAEKQPLFIIQYLDGEHPVFADYTVENPVSRGIYKVALRSNKPGPNFCTCMDFKTNMLGTCKHVEAVLYNISKNKKLRKRKYSVLPNVIPAKAGIYTNNYLYGFRVKRGMTNVRNS
ncbi:MAG: SWIM zinc finger family protein [Patescibacteria group bacterium]